MVLAAETHASSYGFGHEFVVRDMVNIMFQTELLVDRNGVSKTLFNVAAKQEKSARETLGS